MRVSRLIGLGWVVWAMWDIACVQSVQCGSCWGRAAMHSACGEFVMLGNGGTCRAIDHPAAATAQPRPAQALQRMVYF